MLRQIVNCSRQRIMPSIRCQSNVTINNETNLKWDLLVGIQIERLPIITRTLNKKEREYQVKTKFIVFLSINANKMNCERFHLNKNFFFFTFNNRNCCNKLNLNEAISPIMRFV